MHNITFTTLFASALSPTSLFSIKTHTHIHINRPHYALLDTHTHEHLKIRFILLHISINQKQSYSVSYDDHLGAKVCVHNGLVKNSC